MLRSSHRSYAARGADAMRMPGRSTSSMRALGEPSASRPVTRRKLLRLMPARTTPLGASAATAAGDGSGSDMGSGPAQVNEAVSCGCLPLSDQSFLRHRRDVGAVLVEDVTDRKAADAGQAFALHIDQQPTVAAHGAMEPDGV